MIRVHYLLILLICIVAYGLQLPVDGNYKLDRKYRTPEDYGANGYDTVDDTAAITAMLEANKNGGYIIMDQPEAVYYIANITIDQASDMFIDCGTTKFFVASTSNRGIKMTNFSNITWSHPKFESVYSITEQVAGNQGLQMVSGNRCVLYSPWAKKIGDVAYGFSSYRDNPPYGDVNSYQYVVLNGVLESCNQTSTSQSGLQNTYQQWIAYDITGGLKFSTREKEAGAVDLHAQIVRSNGVAGNAAIEITGYSTVNVTAIGYDILDNDGTAGTFVSISDQTGAGVDEISPKMIMVDIQASNVDRALSITGSGNTVNMLSGTIQVSSANFGFISNTGAKIRNLALRIQAENVAEVVRSNGGSNNTDMLSYYIQADNCARVFNLPSGQYNRNLVLEMHGQGNTDYVLDIQGTIQGVGILKNSTIAGTASTVFRVGSAGDGFIIADSVLSGKVEVSGADNVKMLNTTVLGVSGSNIYFNDSNDWILKGVNSLNSASNGLLAEGTHTHGTLIDYFSTGCSRGLNIGADVLVGIDYHGVCTTGNTNANSFSNVYANDIAVTIP